MPTANGFIYTGFVARQKVLGAVFVNESNEGGHHHPAILLGSHVFRAFLRLVAESHVAPDSIETIASYTRTSEARRRMKASLGNRRPQGGSACEFKAGREDDEAKELHHLFHRRSRSSVEEESGVR
jgi:hypothetical protein